MGLLGRGSRDDRSGTFDAIVVGLGNPGTQYARTRHNVGEECVRVLAQQVASELKPGRDSASTADVRLSERRVILAFPSTYMNESGKAVAALMRRHGVRDANRIVVVHDELDLAPGTVRVKVGGGLGGHNGLRSITERIGTQDFVRVRIGVGKPPSKERGADHVLSKVPAAEREILDVGVRVAADAVLELLGNGPAAAMNRFNGS